MIRSRESLGRGGEKVWISCVMVPLEVDLVALCVDSLEVVIDHEACEFSEGGFGRPA